MVLLQIGLRSHLRRPTRTVLTLCGIGAGVALLFAAMALHAALRTSIDRHATGTAGASDLELLVPFRGISAAQRRAVATMPGVRAAVPVVRLTTRLHSDVGEQLVLVLGVGPSFARLFPDALGRSGDQIAGLRGSVGVLLGPALADEAGTGKGRLYLDTPRGAVRLPPTEPLATVPFSDLNAGAFLVMGIDEAASTFARRGRADVLYITASGTGAVRRLRPALTRRFGSQAIVTTPREQGRGYEATFESLAQLTRFGALAALLVALFVVFNTLSMSLMERRHTIALLSVLGTTRTQLAGSLLAEAAVLGTVGALLGMAGGYAICLVLLAQAADAYPFLPIPTIRTPQVSLGLVALTWLLGVAISLLGAAVPVHRILRSNPVEAMSREPSYEWGAQQRPSWHRAARSVGLALCAVVATALFASRGPHPSRAAIIAIALLLLTMAALALPPIVRTGAAAAGLLLRRTLGPLGLLVVGSLERNPRRTTITVGVLALATALVIGLGAALASFESNVTRLFRDRYGPPLYVTATSYSGFTSEQPLPGEAARALKRVPGVRAVYPFRFLPLNVGGRQALIVSAPMVREARDGFSNAIVDTHGATPKALKAGLVRGGVVPSTYTADHHGLTVGEAFTLPGIPAPLRIVGVYEDVLAIDAMYLERQTYVRLSGDRSADRIAIGPEPGVSTSTLETRLRRVISRRGIPAVVERRGEVIDDVLSSVRRTFAVTRALQLLTLLITALIVANTMLTSVAERRWEFGLCRTLGMGRRQVYGEVLLESLVISLIGAALAAALGVAVGFLMLESVRTSFAWEFGLQVEGARIGLALGAAVGAAVGAALLPARIAGRDALRVIRDGPQ